MGDVTDKLKHTVRSVRDRLKETGEAVVSALPRTTDPLYALECAYCDEAYQKMKQHSGKQDRAFRRDLEMTKKEQAIFKKRVQQAERKLLLLEIQKKTASQEYKLLKLQRQKDSEHLKKIIEALFAKNKKAEQLREEEAKAKEEIKKKAQKEFYAMSDEQKVEYAKELDRKGNPVGRKFLEKVVRDGDEMEMNVASQDLARKHLGKEKTAVKQFAKEASVEAENTRNNNLGSTLDNARVTDVIRSEEKGDPRGKYSITKEAASMHRTEQHLRNKGLPPQRVQERESRERKKEEN